MQMCRYGCHMPPVGKQKWWPRACRGGGSMLCLPVCLWNGAWLHLENVGAEQLEVNFLQHSLATSLSYSCQGLLLPETVAPRVRGELPGSACTCGLRRILGEADHRWHGRSHTCLQAAVCSWCEGEWSLLWCRSQTPCTAGRHTPKRHCMRLVASAS